MRLALREAQRAEEAGEVPVGALLVEAPSGRVIARAHNQRELLRDPTAHAEILAITQQGNDRFGQFMRDGIADGSVRPVNVEVAQQMITGAMNASMDLPMWRKMGDPERAAMDFYHSFFNGLKPR